MARGLARWAQYSMLTRILLVLSAFASAAVVVVVVFVGYLVIGGYSGGNSPTSVTAVLFPVALLFFIVIGIPAILVCLLLWIGFAVSARRGTRKDSSLTQDGAASPPASDS